VLIDHKISKNQLLGVIHDFNCRYVNPLISKKANKIEYKIVKEDFKRKSEI